VVERVTIPLLDGVETPVYEGIEVYPGINAGAIAMRVNPGIFAGARAMQRETPMKKEYVIGVDVGTGSVRVGIFDLRGALIAHAQKDIQIWHPQENYVEQSSTNIWNSTCHAVKEALRASGVESPTVAGISFDATCSLVALGPDDGPIPISTDGDSDRNIIVWMDHRAINQAERINARKHRVLRYVGGKISPEMQPPKLLWIKENLPEVWKSTSRFLDLADFMTYRATGIDVRSLCTTVCKWTFMGKENRWDFNFFKQNGIHDLLVKDKIGTDVRPMGSLVGPLSVVSAAELGLTTATKVAVGIIDAHAGGLGVIGLGFDSIPRASGLERILALIGGTSTCHMAVSREPRFIPGIWGPYYGAMVPGMWLTEGGQSATGSLIDHIIRENSRYDVIREDAAEQGRTVYQELNAIVDDLKRKERKGPEITKEINILPYFHGNRSPRADPTLKGVVSGLTLDDGLESLARKYYAAIQAIAYGTRHIVEEMNRSGYRIRAIHACGGGTKNPVWLQEHADITGCEIILPKESEAVLLGSAILAAVGAGKYGSILEAAVGMSSPGERYVPDRNHAAYHSARYGVFKRMYADFLSYRKMLARF
jgi:FGGY-family pentulose kinase